MVSFQCDGCSDVVKKPKLDAHHSRCYASFTCIDCSTTFDSPAQYKSHTSCISEAEKYQKSLYKRPKSGQAGTGPHNRQNATADGKYTYAQARQYPHRPQFNRSYAATGANGTPLGTPTRMSPVNADVSSGTALSVNGTPSNAMAAETALGGNDQTKFVEKRKSEDIAEGAKEPAKKKVKKSKKDRGDHKASVPGEGSAEIEKKTNTEEKEGGEKRKEGKRRKAKEIKGEGNIETGSESTGEGEVKKEKEKKKKEKQYAEERETIPIQSVSSYKASTIEAAPADVAETPEHKPGAVKTQATKEIRRKKDRKAEAAGDLPGASEEISIDIPTQVIQLDGETPNGGKASKRRSKGDVRSADDDTERSSKRRKQQEGIAASVDTDRVVGRTVKKKLKKEKSKEA